MTQARKVAANDEFGTRLRDRVGVVNRVHVPESVNDRAGQSQCIESSAAGSIAVWSVLIGTSANMPGTGRRSPDKPVPTIVGRTKNGVDARRQQSRRGAFEIRHGHLGSVHADEEHRAVRVRSHASTIAPCKTLAEATLPLGNDDEPARDPAVGDTLERDHRGRGSRSGQRRRACPPTPRRPRPPLRLKSTAGKAWS